MRLQQNLNEGSFGFQIAPIYFRSRSPCVFRVCDVTEGRVLRVVM